MNGTNPPKYIRSNKSKSNPNINSDMTPERIPVKIDLTTTFLFIKILLFRVLQISFLENYL